MCPRKEGVNLRVQLETPRGNLHARRHWCLPKTPAESAEHALQLLWGLCSALFQAVGENEVFTLSVTVEGAVFLESPAHVLAGLPENHPLIVHADELCWHPGLPRPERG